MPAAFVTALLHRDVEDLYNAIAKPSGDLGAIGAETKAIDVRERLDSGLMKLVNVVEDLNGGTLSERKSVLCRRKSKIAGLVCRGAFKCASLGKVIEVIDLDEGFAASVVRNSKRVIAKRGADCIVNTVTFLDYEDRL